MTGVAVVLDRRIVGNLLVLRDEEGFLFDAEKGLTSAWRFGILMQNVSRI